MRIFVLSHVTFQIRNDLHGIWKVCYSGDVVSLEFVVDMSFGLIIFSMPFGKYVPLSMMCNGYICHQHVTFEIISVQHLKSIFYF